MAVNLKDPMLMQALEEGRLSLDAQGADEARSMAKYMGRFGVQNPEFYASALQGQERAKRLAMQRLQADLGMNQARHDLWKQKMDMWMEGQAFQRKQQRWADQLQRQQAIGTGIGGLGSMLAMGLGPGGFLTKAPVEQTLNMTDVPSIDPRWAHYNAYGPAGSAFQWSRP